MSKRMTTALADCTKHHVAIPSDQLRRKFTDWNCPYCRITKLEDDNTRMEEEIYEWERSDEQLQAQLEAVKPLYIAINEMMAVLGAVGEINTRHEKASAVMDALHDLDSGVYDVDKFMQSLEKNHG